MSTLVVPQIDVIKALVDLLAAHNLSPLHLKADAKRVGDTRPDITLWMQTRTDFEALCQLLGAKAKEARYAPAGQRSWHAEHDTAQRRLLVHCVSFEHHDDWEPR